MPGEGDLVRLKKLLERESHLRGEAESMSAAALRGLQQKYAELVHANAQLDLFHRVATAANAATTPAEVFMAALETISRHFACPVGHVFLPDAHDPRVFVPSDWWQLADPAKYAEFRRETMAVTVMRGRGLVGRVVESRRPEWLLDVPVEAQFQRAAAAARCGLRGALAFPVISRGGVSAVLEFFADQPREPSRRQLETFAFIGIHLGRVADLLAAEAQMKEKDAELAHQLMEIQHLATLSAHDLQEPLRMVVSYLELLQRRFSGRLDPGADEYIAFATGGALRMKGLLGDFLTYARLWAPPSRHDTVSPQEIAQQVVARSSHRIRAAGAEVTVAPDLPLVRGERAELAELLDALFDNALKFRGDAPPVIALTWERRGPQAVFTLKDNGPGIDPKFHDNLFWLFRRLHREEDRGRGLGLAKSRRIVERHGGRIWVESSPGQGTAIRFTLPLASETRREPAPGTGSSPAAPAAGPDPLKD